MASITERTQHANQLGGSFIRQYYRQFSQEPRQLRQMYHGSQSVLCHVEDGNDPKPVSGETGIEDELLRLGQAAVGCKFSLTSVHCIPSLPDRVMVVVTGSLHKRDGERRFTQNFVLAPMANSYYIHDDYMHISSITGSPTAFQNESPLPPHQPDAPTQPPPPPPPPHTSPPRATPPRSSPPRQESPPPPEVGYGDEGDDEVEEEEQEEDEGIVAEAGMMGGEIGEEREDDQHWTGGEELNDEDDEDKAPPGSYAAALARRSGAAARTQTVRSKGAAAAPVAPLSARTGRTTARSGGGDKEWAPKEQRTEAVWGSTGATKREGGKKGEKGEGKSREKGAKGANGGWNAEGDTQKFQYHSLYVQGIPDEMTEDEIIEVFSKFGQVKGNKRRQRDLFVDYESQDAMLAAIEAGDHKGGVSWMGHRLTIQRRKSPEERRSERDTTGGREGDDSRGGGREGGSSRSGGKGGRGKGGKGGNRGRGGSGRGGRGNGDDA